MNSRHGLRLATAATCLMAAAGLWSAVHAWTAPERVDRRPEGYHTFMPALTVTPDDAVHVVWAESPAPGFEEKVMYARKNGDAWTIPANISRDSGDLRTQVIASDTLGRLVVVWSEEGGARIRYVRQLGDTWSLPKLCFPDHGITPRVVADSRGRIHLVFEDLASQGGIWYSYYVADADSWATPSRVALGTAELGWSSLAVDRFDHLHAVWGNWGTYGIDYAHNDGSGWTQPAPLPDPDTSGQSCDPCVAADLAGKPHVVWEERTHAGYFTYYSTMDGDSWTTPCRPYDQTGSRPVVATDTFNQVHAVWGRNDGMRHAVRAESGWGDPVVFTDSAIFNKSMVRHGTVLYVAWELADWTIAYSEHRVTGALEDDRPLRVALGPGMFLTPGLLLTYTLRETLPVRVVLVDATGRLTCSRTLGLQGPGTHKCQLAKAPVRPGVYFVQVRAGISCWIAKAIIAE
jgi:hypothetical protein